MALCRKKKKRTRITVVLESTESGTWLAVAYCGRFESGSPIADTSAQIAASRAVSAVRRQQIEIASSTERTIEL